MRWAALTFCLLLPWAVASLQAQTTDELETRLLPVATTLRNALLQKNPDGKELTVATVPLVDPGQARVRKLGVVAAQIVERQLVAGKPEWLRIQSRINLASLVDEQKLWITNLVKDSAKENSAPAGFLEKADFLVVGSVTPGDAAVTIELRLVTTRNGNVVCAQSASVPISPAMRDLLKFPQRGAAGTDAQELATVGDIRLSITAQRAGAPGAPPREWQAKEGENQKGGCDQFYLRFTADADACVYLFLFGSDNQAALLFPSADWEPQFERQFGRKAQPQDNYCRADLEYTVPSPDAASHQRFFKLDTTPGVNTLFLCASRSEIRNPQDAVKRLNETTSGAEQTKVLTDTFKFDCVKTFSFRQDDGK